MDISITKIPVSRLAIGQFALDFDGYLLKRHSPGSAHRIDSTAWRAYETEHVWALPVGTPLPHIFNPDTRFISGNKITTPIKPLYTSRPDGPRIQVTQIDLPTMQNTRYPCILVNNGRAIALVVDLTGEVCRVFPDGSGCKMESLHRTRIIMQPIQHTNIPTLLTASGFFVEKDDTEVVFTGEDIR